MTILKVENLTISFGGVVAISQVSFDIPKGKITSIIGPNGAGKTTLINLVTGVYTPTEGRILFQDEDITGHRAYARCRRGLARTFQTPQIFTNMSAVENVMVGAHCHDETSFMATLFRLPRVREASRRCEGRSLELLAYVGLGHYVGADASEMPYGGLKRLEIARALAAKPNLLLLDEPAAGLNPTETAEIGTLVRDLAKGGCTIVMVEHDMKLVMGLSDQIVVLDRGRILAAGTPAEIGSNEAVIKAYLGGGRA